MGNQNVTIETVYGAINLSTEAARVRETYDISVRTKDQLALAFSKDVADIREGRKTVDELREECLSGAEEEYEQGWMEYVDSVEAVAENTEMFPSPNDPDEEYEFAGVDE